MCKIIYVDFKKKERNIISKPKNENLKKESCLDQEALKKTKEFIEKNIIDRAYEEIDW